jgi:hypothetical protein
MKKILFISLLVTFTIFSVFAGEPVPGAEVFIEQEPNEEPIAFQQTGSSGTVTFDHLDKGKYRILIVLPKQKGKLARDADKFDDDMKLIYNTNKKTYLLHEKEGFFALKFDDFKRVKNSNIKPVYKVEKNRNGERIVIASFEIDSKIGEITLHIEALTSKKFSSDFIKTKHDTAKATINNVR